MLLIERFDPAADAGRLRACHEIVAAGRHYDDPSMPPRSFASFTAWWAHGYNSNPRQAWLATDTTGEPVGCYLLILPERENTARAMCFLVVGPESRRAGAGTALLRHCSRQARLARRSYLASEAREDSAGAAFAAAAGATMGLAEVYRQLRVDAELLARIAGLRHEAQQHARGYSLQSWLGATPTEHLADVARLSDAMADAPRDPGVQPEVWDADRIKALELVNLGSGLQSYSVAARHDETGEMAALTQLSTDPGAPGWGFQELTAVLPEHRGHRLGLLVKVAMLELVTSRDRDLQRILTSNAGPNDHMIAINTRLGFEVSSVYRSWELDLTSADQA